MLSSRCCSHGTRSLSLSLSLSLTLLPHAKPIPSHSRGTTFGAKLWPLKRGALCGASSNCYWRCATSTRPPPPPPPPNFGGDDSSGSISRFQEELSKIKDRVRIFFTVLFWMSLFFWSSAWDGTDDSRNKKGPRFGKKFK